MKRSVLSRVIVTDGAHKHVSTQQSNGSVRHSTCLETQHRSQWNIYVAGRQTIPNLQATWKHASLY